MKKKLALVLILSYVGGSFSGEPLSPFGENPFAPHTEEHSNPFQTPSQEQSAPAFSVPSVSSQESHPMPVENPFAVPALHEASPFGEPHQEEHREENVAEHVPQHPESEPIGVHFEPVIESSHVSEQTVEGVTEKKPDTGEDAAIDSEVDTFEQEGSGNWLLKRVWWEKTEAVYEQIKQVFNDIMNARMDYISQRNRLDRELDIAYGEIGLEEGELQDIIDYCLDFTKKEKTEQGFLTKQEEELHAALEHKQHDLEQIKLNLKALQAVDQKIDEALDTLFKQIDVANQYEQKAWDNFKDIARELNDKIARKSYYETEGLLKDIQNVHSYIVSQFSSYFSQTLQTARTHSQNITSQVQALKQAGLDLKKQAAALEHAQEAERLKKELAEQDKVREDAEKKKEVKKNAKAVEQDGILSRFIYSAKTYVLYVADLVLEKAIGVVARIKNWFVKEDSLVKTREKALKLKKEGKSTLTTEESSVSKEASQKEKEHTDSLPIKEGATHKKETFSEIIHEEEHKIREEAEDLKKEVFKEEANVVHSLGSEVEYIKSEIENPFRHESEVKREMAIHPVSVMPQASSGEGSHNPVEKFGLPPTEGMINHPAFSHTPSTLTESKQQKGEQELSPFAR